MSPKLVFKTTGIHSNCYRLEVLVAYNTGTIVIRWIGTYAEYAKRKN